MSNTKHCLRIYIKVTGGDTVTFNQMKSQDDFKKKRLKQNIPNFAVI